jgi:hypothetical protein
MRLSEGEREAPKSAQCDDAALARSQEVMSWEMAAQDILCEAQARY